MNNLGHDDEGLIEGPNFDVHWRLNGSCIVFELRGKTADDGSWLSAPTIAASLPAPQ